MHRPRVRFAPSPTGTLHLGSARTALLNWLFVHAPGPGGTLLLRIDDTDAERSDAALVEGVIDDLRWLGLTWDEGPVFQSERSARYAEALAGLPVIRDDGAYVFEGRVIARADGSALYHLATAVDDVDDAISHVLRGRDHLSNTELQTAIIRALGHEPPVYVHAPLLLGEDGSKLSKREGGVATIADLRDAGFPAGAILNSLALSLADFGTEEVMLTLDDIAARFSLDRLHTADSQFDEAKLRWLSGQHIRAMSDEALANAIPEIAGSDVATAVLAQIARTGGVTFVECGRTVRGVVDPPEPDDEARTLLIAPETAEAFSVFEAALDGVPVPLGQADDAFSALKDALRGAGLRLGPALHGLRAALTGRTQGVEFPLLLAALTEQQVMDARAKLP